MTHPEQVPDDITLDERDLLPEVLAAWGCTMVYCAAIDVWPDFVRWMRESGYIKDEIVNREFLLAASHLLKRLIEEIENDLTITKFEEYLGKESGNQG